MKKINKGSLSDQVYAQLRDALMTGQFEPGQRLSIGGLAEEMGTSVTPVREAIFRLVSDGALTGGKMQSVTVSQLTSAEIMELRKIRILLEGEAAAVAATLATAEQLAEVSRINDAFFVALRSGDSRAASEHNRAFHLLVVEIAALPILLSIIETLWVRMGPSIHHWNLDLRDNAKFGPEHNHFGVIEGLRTRNPDLARTSIQNDIRYPTMQTEESVGSVVS